jgi:hypothetical protein
VNRNQPGLGRDERKAALIEFALGRDRATISRGMDARRVLQLLLAVIWLMDGLLQYQSFMYTQAFGQMIAGTAAGNPGVIARPISWNAGASPARSAASVSCDSPRSHHTNAAPEASLCP